MPTLLPKPKTAVQLQSQPIKITQWRLREQAQALITNSQFEARKLAETIRRENLLRLGIVEPSNPAYDANKSPTTAEALRSKALMEDRAERLRLMSYSRIHPAYRMRKEKEEYIGIGDKNKQELEKSQIKVRTEATVPAVAPITGSSVDSNKTQPPTKAGKKEKEIVENVPGNKIPRTPSTTPANSKANSFHSVSPNLRRAVQFQGAEDEDAKGKSKSESGKESVGAVKKRLKKKRMTTKQAAQKNLQKAAVNLAVSELTTSARVAKKPANDGKLILKRLTHQFLKTYLLFTCLDPDN